MKRVIFLLAIACFQLADGIGQSSVLRVQEPSEKQQLNMPWRNCIAVGRAQNLLRADLLKHMEYAQKIMGYRYCRFHAIFDDQLNVVNRDPKTGRLFFQWHETDQIYDALLKLGIRPFVELNPMPQVLASGTQTMFDYKMNVTPPKSYDEWGYLIESFTRHLVERYGLEEVRKWYFEVWNEPNLGAFWSGSQNDYWRLYESSARAIKRVDAKLRVGGPASSKANWVKEIISYTSKNKIPLDFVSTHLYAQDEQVEFPDRKGSPYKVGDYFSATIKEVEKWVKASERPDLEIHWTEWNSQSAASAEKITWGDNIYVDNLYAASFIVRNCIEVDKVCNTLTYWVLSDIFDEGGIPHTPYSTRYGLLSIYGIPKASFNAFRLLRKMEGTIMKVGTDKPIPNGKGLLVTRELGLTKILLWNQNFVEVKEHTDWDGRVEIPTENDSILNAVNISIGIGKGSPWESWQQMGRPDNPTPTQIEYLWNQSEPAFSFIRQEVKKGIASFPFRLKPGEVQYFEIAAPGQAVNSKYVNPEEFVIWDKGMGERTK
jgi:xylan 1,4-beta-xylosidase